MGRKIHVKIPVEVGGSLHVHDGAINAELKIDEIPEDRVVENGALAALIQRDRKEHGKDHWAGFELLD